MILGGMLFNKQFDFLILFIVVIKGASIDIIYYFHLHDLNVPQLINFWKIVSQILKF